MKNITSSELKSILHSKRANLYYLEHCRVLVNGGRVEYVTEDGDQSLYWNIPIANTIALLLGTGTSITQAAVRELSKAGVVIGFSGGGGTPLFASVEYELDLQWLCPQSEYRPTEYLHRWINIWQNDQKRLQAAKLLQQKRLQNIQQYWISPAFVKEGFSIQEKTLQEFLNQASKEFEAANSTEELFLIEARLTKKLFGFVARIVGYGSFTREKQGKGNDPANKYLDHGNYLAYGLGAAATWVLGLPHGLSVFHGKTRRGGLVFDAADLIKDALVLPQAFISAVKGHDARDFRKTCINNFVNYEALDTMIDSLKTVAMS